DQIVRRGQSVTLVASAGGISVNMNGVALTDGGLNQRIRVENMHSGRIVEGIVRSREHVEVLLPGSTKFFNARPKVSPTVADTGFSNNDR
ncbi:MAG: flagellar basal body P-ring formation chaperone FlgA, partial [Pseudomonadota bacterium]